VVGGLSGLWVCPACRAALGALPPEPEGLRCPGCDASYPRLGGIPLLLADAASIQDQWRRQLASFVVETEAAERYLWAELVLPERVPSTRRRLRRVAEAMPEHRRSVLELFAEVGLEPTGPGTADASLLDYVTLIHRDYGWGAEADEVTPALDQLLGTLPPRFQLGTTLVLGAGSGRLAWDLAARFPSTQPVVALDLNPLPLLVTQRLLRGRPVELYELPGHPRSADQAAVRRLLDAPAPRPPGLELLIADGLSPPFCSASFDTVVTPWFLDQVPADLALFLPEVARLLRPGGAWLHTGPFVYGPAHTRPAHRYGQDEFFELAQQSGFEITTSTYDAAPYLCSPLSTQGRKETVLSMHAIKGQPAVTDSEPAWLAVDYDGPIPRPHVSDARALPLPILTSILELIDGTRRATDITRVLLARGELADDGNAEVVVRGCLRVLWKAAG